MSDNSVLTLNDYVSKLLDEKNFGTVTTEVREELINDILRQLHDYLIAKLLDILPDSEIKELNSFLDLSPTDEQLQKFIANKLDDPKNFIAGVLQSFRKTYLGLEG